MSTPTLAAGPGDPSLSLSLVDIGPLPVLAAAGEVDLTSAHLLTDLVERLLRDEPLRLVLDLAAVTFFGAEGITALLRIRGAVAAQAGELVLRDPSPVVLRTLTITGTADAFRIEEGDGRRTAGPRPDQDGPADVLRLTAVNAARTSAALAATASKEAAERCRTALADLRAVQRSVRDARERLTTIRQAAATRIARSASRLDGGRVTGSGG